MANPPQRPPWFRQMSPGASEHHHDKDDERDIARSSQQGSAFGTRAPLQSDKDERQSAGMPHSPISHPQTPNPQTPNPQTHQPQTPQSQPSYSSGRFPIRPPEEVAPKPSDDDKSQKRVSLETRMLALEHDYARSAETWRESALAMVRALEILENRIGLGDQPQKNPVDEKMLDMIGDQLEALRSEIAHLRTRVEHILPPPQQAQSAGGFRQPSQSSFQASYQASSQSPYKASSASSPKHPSSSFSYGANDYGAGDYGARDDYGNGGTRSSRPLPYSQKTRPAKLKSGIGSGFLSFLATLSGIVLAYYLAAFINDARGDMNKEQFLKMLSPQSSRPAISQKQSSHIHPASPKELSGKKLSAVDHYQKAMRFYEDSQREKSSALLKSALSHFQKASDRDLVAAQFYLGLFYQKALGVSKNIAQAIDYYTQAAKAGHVQAMHNLGVIYLEGLLLTPNIALASEWFLKAAGYGSPQSMNRLGVINEEGHLGARNIIHAYAWYLLASRLGDTDSAIHLSRLEVSLSPRNLKEALALVNSWRYRDFDPRINGQFDKAEAKVKKTANANANANRFFPTINSQSHGSAKTR